MRGEWENLGCSAAENRTGPLYQKSTIEQWIPASRPSTLIGYAPTRPPPIPTPRTWQ